MTLDYDAYENVGDEFISGRLERKNRKVGKKNEEKKDRSSSTPITRISRILERFNYDEIKDLPEKIESLKLKRSNYIGWVKAALEDEQENLMNDADLEIKIDSVKGIINILHLPTGFYSHTIGGQSVDSNLIIAKDNVFIQLDNNLKDWKRTPSDFRQLHGVINDHQLVSQP